MPEISIIVPVYNTAPYLPKCLNSIIRQSFTDVEIIVVNDGSTDNSRGIIEEYAAKESRIRYIEKVNEGPFSARNAALEVSSGSYVMFVDSDDWIDFRMTEEMHERAVVNAAEIVICNYTKVYADRKQEENILALIEEVISIRDMGLNAYFDQYFFHYVHGEEVCNKLYKRDLIEKQNIRFESNALIFSEDMLFNLTCLLFADRICSLPDSYYFYLQRKNSIMNSHRENYFERHLVLAEKFMARAKECNRFQELEESLPKLFLYCVWDPIFTRLENGYYNFLRLYKTINIAKHKHFYIMDSIYRLMDETGGSINDKDGVYNLTNLLIKKAEDRIYSGNLLRRTAKKVIRKYLRNNFRRFFDKNFRYSMM